MKRRFELIAIRNSCLSVKGRLSFMALRYCSLQDALERNILDKITFDALNSTRLNRERMEIAQAKLAEATKLISEAAEIIRDSAKRP